MLIKFIAFILSGLIISPLSMKSAFITLLLTFSIIFELILYKAIIILIIYRCFISIYCYYIKFFIIIMPFLIKASQVHP